MCRGVFVFVDGSYTEDGTGTFGYLIIKNGEILVEEHGLADFWRPSLMHGQTSVTAEYDAFIKALETARRLKLCEEKVTVYSDLKSLAVQFRTGKGKSDSYLRAVGLLKKFQNIEIKWIPRKRNIAHTLAKQAHHDTGFASFGYVLGWATANDPNFADFREP